MLYTIGDLHLSLTSGKSMEVFGGAWQNYVEKIEDGFSTLKEDDLTVLCGDISWGMSLEESEEDFLFIERLPGKKLIIKGNHDFWFSTAAKMNRFFEEKGIESIRILNNNSFEYGDFDICGSRGWFFEENKGTDHDKKMVSREVQRIEMSINAGKHDRKILFLHYPPVFGNYTCDPILELIEKYRIERCYYGHVHGDGIRYAFNGNRNGTVYTLVSADFINFKPVCVESTDFS